nr:hypothetical protein [Tanacetum cinerariifolium]
SHVTLTPTHSDGQQESSSISSFVTSRLNPIIDPGMESIFTTGSSTVTPISSPKSTITPSIITRTTTASQPPVPPTSIPSDIYPTLLTFASVFRFEDRVKSLEVNFSNILGIVHQYMHQQMPEAVQEAVKSQVKAQVTRILPRIEESVNAQLKAEVLTRSSHSSRTSYTVAADLSEMELKKILIDKMEGNKSIQRSDEQRNLYKALVEAYDANKTILDTYEESAILKRRKEPVQTTCQMEEPSHPVFETGAEDQPIVQTSQHPEWFSQPRRPPIPDRDWNKTLPAAQGKAHLTELEYHLEEVYKATTDQLDWDNPKGQQYPHNLLQPLPLIPDNRGRRVIPFEHFINNDLEYLRGGASSQKYTTSVTKTNAADYGHIKWIEDLVPRAM